MASKVSAIQLLARHLLNEEVPRFWSEQELLDITAAGVKDLWRSIVDLKQEHYLTVDITNVSYVAGDTTLTGVPADVHKVYMVEPRDMTETGSNTGLVFTPKEYNHKYFQAARSLSAIEPTNATIYYALAGAGAPVAAPTIYVAPKVTSTVNIAFSYIPSLAPVNQWDDNVPIPGEADNALVAWTVAYARAKERDDKAPDPGWLQIYATEKANILQGLGLREYQEPVTVDAVFEEYW